MAKIVVKSKAKKIKRKFPVEITAPEYLNSTKLGTSNVTDLTSLVGKTTKVNMMYVTGNIKNQNIRLTFQIIEVNSGLAKTQVKIYEQIPYYLGRAVKAGSDLVEDSFVCKSKDGINVRVKPFMVTKLNTSQLTKSLLRTKSIEIISKEVSSKSYDEFISSVVTGKIQLGLKNDLKKIFPLKAFEFKKVSLE